MRAAKAFFLALAALFLLVVMPAASASALDLTTSPLPINLSAKPGTSVSTEVRVKNDEPNTQTLDISLLKFTAYGEEGKPALVDRGPGDDYFDWVSFSPNTIVAPPGVWMSVTMTINVPKDAGFSYYYAVVFKPQGKPVGKGNVFLGASAVLVLLDTQNPNAKRSIQIESFTSDKKAYEFLPAYFTVKMHNNGNVHVVPHGNIFIKRGSKIVASLILNPQQGNILPGTNRNYRVSWGDGFPVYQDKVVNNKTVKSLNWNFSQAAKLKFGHYTAQLDAVYDDGTKDVPLKAVVSFWIIPWRIIAGILVLIVLILAGLWASTKGIFKRFKRKKSNKDEPKT